MNWNFWRIRSRWDYAALPSLLLWVFGVALVITRVLIFGFADASPLLLDFSVALFGLPYLLFFFTSPLAVLAVVYGSGHHEHLDPGLVYEICSFLLAPITGVHYLYRTGQEE